MGISEKNPSLHSVTEYQIYSGAGNDFVMIYNMNSEIPASKQAELTVKICNKQFKNMDGVIFVDKPKGRDASIRMSYYNRDGSYGAMCGNGARCTVQYAADNGLLNEKSFLIEAVDKLYTAEIITAGIVKIGFPDITDYKLNIHIELGKDLAVSKLHWMNAGSEHIILFTDDIMHPKISSIGDVNVNDWGSLLRFHESLQPKGANINFVQISGSSSLNLRTYERGVERETLACGTGIISSSVISGLLGLVKSPVTVKVRSGENLTAEFSVNGAIIEKVFLTGSAKKTGEGELMI